MEKRGPRNERDENKGEVERSTGYPTGARGNYKIAKINHKTWPVLPCSTIKLAGRSADRRIFLAFTTNHVAAVNARYFAALSLSFVPPLSRCGCSREKKIAPRFCGATRKTMLYAANLCFLLILCSVFDSNICGKISDPLKIFIY